MKIKFYYIRPIERDEMELSEPCPKCGLIVNLDGKSYQIASQIGKSFRIETIKGAEPYKGKNKITCPSCGKGKIKIK
jgi:predicted RNA-binding Zn-ribbon protein involved in translation (DUF1610 family)